MNNKLIAFSSFVAMLLFASLFVVGFIFLGVTNEPDKGVVTLILALMAFVLWMVLLLITYWAKQKSFADIDEKKKLSFRTKAYFFYVAINLPLLISFVQLFEGSFQWSKVLRGVYILSFFIIVFLLLKKSPWAWVLAWLNSIYFLSYSWAFLSQGVLGLFAELLAVFLFVYTALNAFLDFTNRRSQVLDYWLGGAWLFLTILYGSSLPIILLFVRGQEFVPNNSLMLGFLKLIFLFGLAAAVLRWQFKKSNIPVINSLPPQEW